MSTFIQVLMYIQWDSFLCYVQSYESYFKIFHPASRDHNISVMKKVAKPIIYCTCCSVYVSIQS